MMRSAGADRTRREIIRLCGAGLDAPTLRSEVLRRLRTVVPIDAAFFASVDPATMLYTDATVDPVLRPEGLRFVTNELQGDDVNQFVQLARSSAAVRTLAQATRLQWEESARYRDILVPLALGDELRAALRTGGVCWGVLCLHRERGSLFTSAEAAYVADLAPHMARGLRMALLAEAIPTADAASGPGLLVLAPDFSVVASTPVAEQWLADVASDRSPPGNLPRAVYAVAARLRAIEQDDRLSPNADLMPRVRVRTASGRWLLVHASRLAGAGTEGHTAIFLEEARPLEIAPLILSAHQLTAREAEITQLVLRSSSTAEIADRLCLSVHTVQDHLKSIFDKLGVRSRRELIGRIFAEHYLPRLTGGGEP